jgi:TATA-box binding protein (TBP) (component of TFIID and TFIIIB)
MRTLLVTVAVTIDDAGKAQFTCSENVGDNLEIIAILQQEIKHLEAEWKAQQPAQEQNVVPSP